MPSRPSLPNSSASSRTGVVPVSYHSATSGRTRSSATRRVSARMSRSSSVSSVSRSSRSSGATTIGFNLTGESGVDDQDPGVDLVALLQGRAQGAMQTVLQVEGAPVLHDVREQVAVEGRILG